MAVSSIYCCLLTCAMSTEISATVAPTSCHIESCVRHQNITQADALKDDGVTALVAFRAIAVGLGDGVGVQDS